MLPASTSLPIMCISAIAVWFTTSKPNLTCQVKKQTNKQWNKGGLLIFFPLELCSSFSIIEAILFHDINDTLLFLFTSIPNHTTVQGGSGVLAVSEGKRVSWDPLKRMWLGGMVYWWCTIKGGSLLIFQCAISIHLAIDKGHPTFWRLLATLEEEELFWATQ